MKHLSILGSTGSIGTQTLEIIRKFPDKFKIVGLTANSNAELLLKQIKEFKPKAAAILNESKADGLLNFSSCQIFRGKEGINKIAALDEADTIVNSLVGSAGIEPTYNAIQHKKNIALANKETLVAAGSIIMDEVKKNNVTLMPIDSEHSAIFQCLNGEKISEVNKITITCSGGPFKNLTKGQLQNVMLKDALNHPTWSMGNKITIDSSTLMNKGFEIIEAHWLYNIPYEKIEVVIHPQSIIHSLVEFADKSVIAQLGMPDMRIPIQYALTYPERIANDNQQLDIAKAGKLEFREPDFEMFPCLRYAYDAGKTGGTLPCVMNAANEIVVQAFLEEKIKYLDIARIIKQKMDSHDLIRNPTLKDILEVDKKTKEDLQKIFPNSK